MKETTSTDMNVYIRHISQDPIHGSSRIATVTKLIESNVALLLKLNYNGRYADEALPRLHS